MNKRAVRNIVVSVLGIIGVAQATTPVFAANTGDVDFSAELQSSTTVTIPTDPIELNLAPSGAGSFGSTDFNVIVSTNQPGYTITMSTTSTSLTSNTLNPNTNEYFTIPTLEHTAEGYTASNFTRNRWGIAVDSGNFNAVAASNTIKDTNTSANADVTNIRLGTNLDLLTAAGEYQTTIDFAVVTKIIIKSINDLTYMQDFADLPASTLARVKNSMVQNAAYELKDSRDGTVYHVSKLADGNIWLLDNLALDLTNSTVKSNLSASNTNATATSIGALINGGRANGNKYATAGVANWISGYSYSAPLVNMTNKDVVPDYAPANSKGNNKVGGYYNYCAASAGSYCYGNGTSSGSADTYDNIEDICPAGWRMPTGYTSASQPGEYQTLATTITGITTAGNITDTTKISNFRTALSTPLSGWFRDGKTTRQGENGYFWSSRMSTTDSAYILMSATGRVNPVDYSYAIYGYSVRCVVK